MCMCVSYVVYKHIYISISISLLLPDGWMDGWIEKLHVVNVY